MAELHFYELANDLHLLLIWDVNHDKNFTKEQKTVTSDNGVFTVTAKEQEAGYVEATIAGTPFGNFKIGTEYNVLPLEKQLQDFVNKSAQHPKAAELVADQEHALLKKEATRLAQDEKEFHEAEGEHRSYWD